MAQGNQQRMRSIDFPKQFLKKDNIPIIERTVIMLRNKNTNNITIVANNTPLWESFCYKWGLILYSPENPGSCIVSGVNNTQSIWSENHTIFLLGDVIFTDFAM